MVGGDERDEGVALVPHTIPTVDWEAFYDADPMRAEDRLEERVSTDEP